MFLIKVIYKSMKYPFTIGALGIIRILVAKAIFFLLFFKARKLQKLPVSYRITLQYEMRIAFDAALYYTRTTKNKIAIGDIAVPRHF